MAVKFLHEAGVTSELAYTAGFVSIGLSWVAYASSKRNPKEEDSRADRWAIYVGHWAPTFFGLGNALRSYELAEAGSTGAKALKGAALAAVVPTVISKVAHRNAA